MRRSTAVVAASAIGTVSAGVVAAPAQALPVDTCDSYTDHVVSSDGSLDPDWYMECVPQYGAGKVEFGLESDAALTALPADYVTDLNDPSVTVTTDLDTAAVTAYGFPLERGAFFDLDTFGTGPGPTRNGYTAAMVAPIAAVQAVPTSELPAVCDDAANNYPNAYRVDYDQVTTTFSQDANGEHWTSEIAVTPDPLYLAFTPDPSDGSVDGAVCAASGGEGRVESSASISRDSLIEDYVTHDTDAHYSLGPAHMYPEGYLLGDFDRTHTPIVVPDPDPGGSTGGGSGSADSSDDDDALLPDTGRETGGVAVPVALWAALAAAMTGGVALVAGRLRSLSLSKRR